MGVTGPEADALILDVNDNLRAGQNRAGSKRHPPSENVSAKR
jgi:hypothetical protein